MDALDVWLHQDLVGRLRRQRRSEHLEFGYAETVVAADSVGPCYRCRCRWGPAGTANPSPTLSSTDFSPVYDILATVAYPQVSKEASMRVNGHSHIDEIAAADLIAEAHSWGVRLAQASDRVVSILARFGGAVTAAAVATPEAGNDLIDLLLARSARIRRGGDWCLPQYVARAPAVVGGGVVTLDQTMGSTRL